MTLNTPLLYSVNAFDPSYTYEFLFSFSGAQVYSNRAIIIDNNTQLEVYNAKQDGQKLSHTLPANTLEAGRSYLIRVQVYDVNGNYSDFSSTVLFYCFTTPQFYFSNVKHGDIIPSASFELQLAYDQPQSEMLNEYKYFVYDITKDLLYSSESFYTTNHMAHTIYGLENDYSYYVRAIGKTVHGMSVDTGYIQITADYIRVATNVAFKATNDSKTGCVMLKIDIVAVDFEIDYDNYSINNSIVNLTGNALTYMIDLEKDFYMVIKAKQLPLGTFCFTSDESIALSVERLGDQHYIHLHVNGVGAGYHIYERINEGYLSYIGADHITLSEDNMMICQVYKNNDLYDLSVTYE